MFSACLFVYTVRLITNENRTVYTVWPSVEHVNLYYRALVNRSLLHGPVRVDSCSR